MSLAVKEVHSGGCLLFLPCGSQGLNPGGQVWCQAWPAEQPFSSTSLFRVSSHSEQKKAIVMVQLWGRVRHTLNPVREIQLYIIGQDSTFEPPPSSRHQSDNMKLCPREKVSHRYYRMPSTCYEVKRDSSPCTRSVIHQSSSWLWTLWIKLFIVGSTELKEPFTSRQKKLRYTSAKCLHKRLKWQDEVKLAFYSN